MARYYLYTLSNTTTGRVYVGITSNISRRRTHHKYFLNTRKHENIHIQTDYDNGFKFEFIILKDLGDITKEEAHSIERNEIKKILNPYNILHNNSNSQIKNELQSIRMQNKWSDPEFKKSMAIKQMKPIDNETKIKLKAALADTSYKSIFKRARVFGVDYQKLKKFVARVDLHHLLDVETVTL